MLLGSVRLEIRRISGNIRKDQVFWEEGDDDDDGIICVFDPDGIEVIDDAAREKPPYITFEFKFREDPKITQRIVKQNSENVDSKISIQATQAVAQKSLKSGTLVQPAVDRAEGTSFHASACY